MHGFTRIFMYEILFRSLITTLCHKKVYVLPHSVVFLPQSFSRRAMPSRKVQADDDACILS